MTISHSNPVTGQNRRAVGMFPNRRSAESALYALRDSGFPMDHVSVITRDDLQESKIAGADVQDSVSEHRVANQVDNKAEEGAAVGITTGGVLGGLTGLLVGLGSITIPGISPVMLAGATATAIATLAGTAIGAATVGLLGGLIGLGIPEEHAKIYNERIGRGEYLIIVDGNESEIAHAHQILQTHNIEEYRVYDAPGVASEQSAPVETSVLRKPNRPDIAKVAPVSGPATYPVTSATPVTQSSHSAYKRAIGVFNHRRDTEVALTDLKDSGFPMERVSLIAKDIDRNRPLMSTSQHNLGVNLDPRTQGNRADEGAKAGAATGAALGGLGGLLVGLGTLAIPGVGPVIAGGAAATALATALSGGAISAVAGGATGGLVGLGVPENRAQVYNDHLNRGDDVVMVDGVEDEIRQAERILNRHGIHEWEIYDATDVNTTAYSNPYAHRPISQSVGRDRSNSSV